MGTFRFKSDLRNHQAIVQPRLYDSLMVTQITLKVDRIQVQLNRYERLVSESNIWGTVIFKCCTSADWQLVEGNSQ